MKVWSTGKCVQRFRILQRYKYSAQVPYYIQNYRRSSIFSVWITSTFCCTLTTINSCTKVNAEVCRYFKYYVSKQTYMYFCDIYFLHMKKKQKKLSIRYFFYFWFTVLPDYFIDFKPSQSGLWANQSAQCKPPDFLQAENSACLCFEQIFRDLLRVRAVN